MAALRIIEPGMLTTVQDLGRPGHAALGVARSGAADTLSLCVGNRLVGNPDVDAGLEMTLRGGEFEFEGAGVVALAGADAPAVLVSAGEERELGTWAARPVRAGDRLRIGAVRSGARVYLCVAGGVRTEPVLGSRSMHIATGVGGSPLRAGGRLPLGGEAHGARPLPSGARELIDNALARRTLRITGPDSPADVSLRSELARHTFTVQERSDRQGLRLSGPRLAITGGRGRMITEGLPPGAVQVPEGDGPIIILADGPTTGGYPVGACIALVDLPVCGQLRPRDTVRFESVGIDDARRLLRDFRRALDELLPPIQG